MTLNSLMADACGFVRERCLPGGNAIRHFSKLLEQSQWMHSEDIREFQLSEIKKLLKHAYETVPYYRDKLKKNKIHPLDVNSFRDFECIPFLNREDVRLHQTELYSKCYKGKTFEDRTGGSTGQPMRFLMDMTTAYWSYSVEKRYRGWYGYRPGEKKAWVWGALKDFPSWKLKDRMVRAYLKRNRFLNAHTLSFSNMKRFADAMLEWKPDMFRAYPTAITIFAKFLSDHGYSRIKPKLIETSGEKLSIAQRLFLNKIFEAPIAEHYSSWEIYDIGYQCPNGSLHISGHRYLEVVDEQGKPAKPGEIGEIVITPLTQFAMPFIRYKNGDLGVLGAHRCPCGRGLPVLNEVVGRQHDILIRPDGQPVYGSVFGYITHDKPEIKQFQVYQPNRENLEVRLSCYCPVSSEWVSMLISEVQAFFGPEMNIRVVILDDIPLTKSGKLRFIISDIQHAELGHLH
jgi:phenylacetate-CoA ligase